MRPKKNFFDLIATIFSRPKVAGASVFLFLLILIGFITKQKYRIIKDEERQEMLSILNVVKQNIEQSLKNSYTATLTLAVTLNENGVPVDFEKVGAKLVDSNSMIQTVQLVPHGTIKYTYPLKGNEKALGLNILKGSNEVAAGALRTINSRRMYFSGPIPLIQGGYGIIGRLPLFDNGKFWGFSAVVLKLDKFLEQAGVYNNKNDKFFFQFSKINEQAGKETFFLPTKKDLKNSTFESILIPDGDWKLYIVAADENRLWIQLIYSFLLGLLLAAILGIQTFRLFKKPEKLRQLVNKQANELMESELRFKTIFEKAPIGIAEVDTKTGNFIRVNHKFCSILGYTEKELYQTDFQSITFHDDLSDDFEKMQKMKSGEIDEFTLLKRYKHKDGHLIWANLTVKSLWNDVETQTSHIGIVEDVTERMSAEQEAKNSQLRIASLINTIDGIVWEGNPDNFEFTFISKKTEQILGYTAEEWLASPTFWADHIYEDDRNWVVDYCMMCTKELKSHEFEYRMINKEGTLVWLRDIVNVISDGHKPTLLRGIMIDITAHKEAEKVLNDSLTLVTEQNKRLVDFSYIVSHNLRSHASNIDGIVSLIDEASNDEERNEFSGMLKRASTSLNETLMNLNQIVNIKNRIHVNIEPLDLQYYINKTIDSLHQEIAAKDVIINQFVNCDYLVDYNPAYLESILQNFIFNAIRYSHPDRRPEVSIDCLKENGQLVLQISDNGIGINLEKHGEDLFGMYKTFNGNPDAKGIGLFMAKNQIEAMGGKIDVSSAVNVGTTFKIYFK
ncbi:PAS domain S-box protein [Pedobacter sp. ASV1-7]|uniref:sensor histidine kinase n=1 Tax=Pedobacter sp. ASV1-7 TaxID=3145237 RepID=UPI0032E900D6